MTKTTRANLIKNIAPMTFTITLTPAQVFDLADKALDESIMSAYGEDEVTLAGTTIDELIADLANDDGFRKVLREEVEYRLEDAVDNVYISEDDAYKIPLVGQMDKALCKMEEILEESNLNAGMKVDPAVKAALELLVSRGFTVSK